jgi:hypothetical protein
MVEQDDRKRIKDEDVLVRLRNSSSKWVPSISGGLVGSICTVLFIIIPVVNTWLANAKEISLAQIRNNAEQIAYITKRMEDSDKERDLYRQEMTTCQKELRELKNHAK